MAANTRDIRRRIKSIKNTAQITKAMQMVASAKMRKAQGAALAGRPYSELINRVLVSVQQHADVTLHPLLEVRQVNRELVVVISTDKGLCGALNTNLLREAKAFDAGKTEFVAAGRKAQQHLARMKRKLIARPVVKEVWGKPQTVMVNSTSTAFGDLEGIDRGDEFKIVSHLKDCDSCAIAASPTEPARFLFFTDVPEPYVGFDWMGGKSLPVEGGYLCIVIAVSQIPGRGPSLVTAFPCARAYYTSKNATVIHR